MPDKSTTGIMRAIPEASIAATWVSTMVEIRSPSDSATVINRSDSTNSQPRLPATGTSSRYTEISRILTKFTSDRAR